MKVLAIRYGVSLQLPRGVPKKMEAVNAELRTAGVSNTLEQKQVTAWLAIRNSAAHGDYADYDQDDIEALIVRVHEFSAKYA